MVYKLLTTHKFDKWFQSLKDKKVRYRLEARISQIQSGHFGDTKPLSAEWNELRFFFGGGIRIYYAIRGDEIIILLNGGDKSSQSKDIKTAKELLTKLEVRNDDDTQNV